MEIGETSAVGETLGQGPRNVKRVSVYKTPVDKIHVLKFLRRAQKTASVTIPFGDITFTCDDGKLVVNSVILAACSRMIREILSSLTPCERKNVVISVPGYETEEFMHALAIIYGGEVKLDSKKKQDQVQLALLEIGFDGDLVFDSPSETDLNVSIRRYLNVPDPAVPKFKVPQPYNTEQVPIVVVGNSVEQTNGQQELTTEVRQILLAHGCNEINADDWVESGEEIEVSEIGSIGESELLNENIEDVRLTRNKENRSKHNSETGMEVDERPNQDGSGKARPNKRQNKESLTNSNSKKQRTMPTKSQNKSGLSEKNSSVVNDDQSLKTRSSNSNSQGNSAIMDENSKTEGACFKNQQRNTSTSKATEEKSAGSLKERKKKSSRGSQESHSYQGPAGMRIEIDHGEYIDFRKSIIVSVAKDASNKDSGKPQKDTVQVEKSRKNSSSGETLVKDTVGSSNSGSIERVTLDAAKQLGGPSNSNEAGSSPPETNLELAKIADAEKCVEKRNPTVSPNKASSHIQSENTKSLPVANENKDKRNRDDPEIQPIDVDVEYPPGTDGLDDFGRWNRTVEYCSICKVVYKNYNKAQRCLSKHGRRRCWICLKVMTTGEYIKHCEDEHTVPGGKKGYVKCPHCEKVVDCGNLSTHASLEHIMKTKKKVETPTISTDLSAEEPQVDTNPIRFRPLSEILEQEVEEEDLPGSPDRVLLQSSDVPLTTVETENSQTFVQPPVPTTRNPSQFLIPQTTLSIPKLVQPMPSFKTNSSLSPAMQIRTSANPSILSAPTISTGIPSTLASAAVSMNEMQSRSRIQSRNDHTIGQGLNNGARVVLSSENLKQHSDPSRRPIHNPISNHNSFGQVNSNSGMATRPHVQAAFQQQSQPPSSQAPFTLSSSATSAQSRFSEQMFRSPATPAYTPQQSTQHPENSHLLTSGNGFSRNRQASGISAMGISLTHVRTPPAESSVDVRMRPPQMLASMRPSPVTLNSLGDSRLMNTPSIAPSPSVHRMPYIQNTTNNITVEGMPFMVSQDEVTNEDHDPLAGITPESISTTMDTSNGAALLEELLNTPGNNPTTNAASKFRYDPKSKNYCCKKCDLTYGSLHNAIHDDHLCIGEED